MPWWQVIIDALPWRFERQFEQQRRDLEAHLTRVHGLTPDDVPGHVVQTPESDDQTTV